MFDPSGNLTIHAMERYLNGELSPAERNLVDMHLAESEFDREALEGIQKHSTRNLKREVEDLQAEIKLVAGRKVKPGKVNISRINYWFAAAGMAGLIGLSVLIFYLFREPVEMPQLAVIQADTIVNKTKVVVIPPENNAKKEEESIPLTGQKIQIDPSPIAAPAESYEFQEVIEEPFQPVADQERIATYEPVIVADETGENAEKSVDLAEEDVQMEVQPVGGIAISDDRVYMEEKVAGSEKRTGTSNQALERSAVSKGITVVTEDAPDTTGVFTVVEKMPEFPGGGYAYYKFLADSIQYPQLAIENKIQGTVYVQFVIEKDGSITNIKVLRGIGGGCNEEAVRVIKSMPNWIPGKQKGKPVRVLYNLPIKFNLNKSGSP